MGSRFAGIAPAPVLRSQPQYAAGIDWSNPLAKGLSAAFAFNNSFVSTTPSGKTGNPVVTTGPTFSINKDGYYAQAGGSGQVVTDLYPSQIGFGGSNARTLIFESFWGDNQGAGGMLVGMGTATSQSDFSVYHDNFRSLRLNLFNGDLTYALYGIGGTSARVFVAVTYDGATTVKFRSWVTVAGAGQVILNSQTSTIAGPLSTGDTNSIRLLQNAIDPLYFVGCWGGRVLTDAEIDAVYANKWQIFKATAQRKIFNSSYQASRRVFDPVPPMRQQPQFSPQIDWSNPIANGLVGAYVQWQAKSVLNAVSGKVLIATGFDTQTVVNKAGVAIAGIYGAGDQFIATDDAAATGNNFTVAYGAFIPLSGSAYVYSAVVPGSNVVPRFAANHANEFGMTIAAVADYDSGIVRTAAGYWDVVHTFKSGSAFETTALSNGVASYSSVGIGTISTRQQNLQLFSNASRGEATPVGTAFDYILSWNRPLSKTEAASIAANPWQLFKSPSRNLFTNSPLFPSKAVFTLETPVRTSQPQFAAQVDPKFQKGLVLAYNPGTRIDAPLTGTCKTATLTNAFQSISPFGQAVNLQQTNLSSVFFNGTSGAPNSGGFTILVLGRYSQSTGVQTVLNRDTAGQGGGMEVALYNTFGSPSTRVYSSYKNAGGTGVAFDACFVNGVSTPSNGSYDTVQGQYYCLALRADNIGACAYDFSLGKVTSGGPYYLTGDVVMAAVWDARFPDTVLQSLSANPWQIFK